MTPRVSIIIPTHNRSGIIQRALDSVLAQTFTDFEIIVVDDGSTDDTREVIARYPDFVHYAHQENAGPGAARNHGMRLARGAFIGFLDSDDTIYPDNLAAHLQVFEEHPEAGLVYTGIEVIDADGNPVKTTLPNPEDRGFVFPQLIRHNFIPVSTVVMRRAAMEFAGQWNTTLWFAEDWYYWLRVASRFPIEYVNAPLARIQRSRVSLSHGSELASIAEWNMKMFSVASADPDLAPLLRPLRAEAYRSAYASYASMALETMQLKLARGFAWRAIAAKPTTWSSYPLLAKSCLGAGLLRRMRRWRRS